MEIQEPMSERARRVIGSYLMILGLLMLVFVPWVWSVAWRANESGGGKTSASFLGLDFTASAPATLLAVVVTMAVIGSVTVMTLVFAARAGHNTLEQTYLWWYVTRPVSAAGLGVLVYMFLIAAVFDFASVEDGSSPALVLAAAIGALAGLFTDQVLDRVRKVLGLSPFDQVTVRRRDPNDIGLDLLDEAQVDDEPEYEEATVNRLPVESQPADPMDATPTEQIERPVAEVTVEEPAPDDEVPAEDDQTAVRKVG